jgi:hypothetical protein
MQTTDPQIKRSHDVILETIRNMRIDIVRSLLQTENLRVYLRTEHKLPDPSNVRLEFIKRSLHELLICPIDLVHYGPMILEMKQAADLEVSSQACTGLVHKEITEALRSHLY